MLNLRLVELFSNGYSTAIKILSKTAKKNAIRRQNRKRLVHAFSQGRSKHKSLIFLAIKCFSNNFLRLNFSI